MKTKPYAVKMIAMWVDTEKDMDDWPEGYQPICILGLAFSGDAPALMIFAPMDFLSKADALSVMNMASDTIKRELRDMVQSGQLKQVGPLPGVPPRVH